MKYIATKVLKRLESQKLRGGFNEAQTCLLVPVSFGVSSTCLLHILDQQLQSRKMNGRHAGYKLQVLFIDESSVTDHAFPKDSRALLVQRYPCHTFTTVALEDYLEYDANITKPWNGSEKDMKKIILSLPSVTSKIDFIEVCRRRLIQAVAKKLNCDCILSGDSTTRLAERTLSETAKGRGATLPWLIADGKSSGGNYIYPLRDILKKELDGYARFVSPPLTDIIAAYSQQNPVCSKDATIDRLMVQYFESVEQNYPSIVANVVRTSDRLMPPTIHEDNRKCSLCGHAIVDSVGMNRQPCATLPHAEDTNEFMYDVSLCYGCKRTISR